MCDVQALVWQEAVAAWWAPLPDSFACPLAQAAPPCTCGTQGVRRHSCNTHWASSPTDAAKWMWKPCFLPLEGPSGHGVTPLISRHVAPPSGNGCGSTRMPMLVLRRPAASADPPAPAGLQAEGLARALTDRNRASRPGSPPDRCDLPSLQERAAPFVPHACQTQTLLSVSPKVRTSL